MSYNVGLVHRWSRGVCWLPARVWLSVWHCAASGGPTRSSEPTAPHWSVCNPSTGSQHRPLPNSLGRTGLVDQSTFKVILRSASKQKMAITPCWFYPNCFGGGGWAKYRSSDLKKKYRPSLTCLKTKVAMEPTSLVTPNSPWKVWGLCNSVSSNINWTSSCN